MKQVPSISFPTLLISSWRDINRTGACFKNDEEPPSTSWGILSGNGMCNYWENFHNQTDKTKFPLPSNLAYSIYALIEAYRPRLKIHGKLFVASTVSTWQCSHNPKEANCQVATTIQNTMGHFTPLHIIHIIKNIWELIRSGPKISKNTN